MTWTVDHAATMLVAASHAVISAALLRGPDPPRRGTSEAGKCRVMPGVPDTRRRDRAGRISGASVPAAASRPASPDGRPPAGRDRTSGVEGQSVSVRVDLGGRRIIKKKKEYKKNKK